MFIVFNFLALIPSYLVENQPIGKKLFREFCAKNKQYDNQYKFIEAIVLIIKKREINKLTYLIIN